MKLMATTETKEANSYDFLISCLLVLFKTHAPGCNFLHIFLSIFHKRLDNFTTDTSSAITYSLSPPITSKRWPHRIMPSLGLPKFVYNFHYFTERNSSFGIHLVFCLDYCVVDRMHCRWSTFDPRVTQALFMISRNFNKILKRKQI